MENLSHLLIYVTPYIDYMKSSVCSEHQSKHVSIGLLVETVCLHSSSCLCFRLGLSTWKWGCSSSSSLFFICSLSDRADLQGPDISALCVFWPLWFKHTNTSLLSSPHLAHHDPALQRWTALCFWCAERWSQIHWSWHLSFITDTDTSLAAITLYEAN